MTPATARTAPEPPMWPASTWGRSARPTTASSVSPACGRIRAAIGRCMWCPTRRRRGWPRASATRGFGPSRSWPPSWSPPARQANVPFRAVVADCFYGDNTGFVEALGRAGVAFVLALKPRKGTWAPADEPHTPVEAARKLGWAGPGRPGPWRRVTRRFRDGHTETWWAADAVLGGWGPRGPHRLVVATTDPATLPKLSTWYLLTNLARPASRRAQQTQLGEIVAAYGLRNWDEQGYKQVKDEFGWADFLVRSDRAIRRHWTLVCCAFSFCWHAGQARMAQAGGPAPPATTPPPAEQTAARGAQQRLDPDRRRRAGRHRSVVAAGTTAGARLAGPVGVAAALLARMVHQPAAPAVAAGA